MKWIKSLFKYFDGKIPFFTVSLFLAMQVFFSIGLIIARIYFTGKLTYIFLIWNLFLAIVPFWLSQLFFYLSRKTKRKFWIFPVLVLWLLFFPNAFYIITDFIHLRARMPIPVWYDIFLFFSAAWNGLLIGFYSLRIMQVSLKSVFSGAVSWAFVTIALLLSAFGVYVGRFLRWNSWDAIRNPFPLLNDIMEKVANPMEYPGTYMVTIILFFFCLIAYACFIRIIHIRPYDREETENRK